MHRIADLTQ